MDKDDPMRYILGVMVVLEAITKNLDDETKQNIKEFVQERLDKTSEGKDSPMGWVLNRYLNGTGFK